MLCPADADIILVETKDITKADICVYKTNQISVANNWELKWKFRNGGWGNFAIYVAKDSTELIVSPENSDTEKADTLKSHGRIYFVTTPDSAKYLNNSFRIEGVMRIQKIIQL